MDLPLVPALANDDSQVPPSWEQIAQVALDLHAKKVKTKGITNGVLAADYSELYDIVRPH